MGKIINRMRRRRRLKVVDLGGLDPKDPVTIRATRKGGGDERFWPLYLDAGTTKQRGIFVLMDKPMTIPREFAALLVACEGFDVTILRDDNPAGLAWLERISAIDEAKPLT